MLDAGNPCVFVDAEALGLDGTESAERIESQTDLMQALEALRRQASVAMGLAPDEVTGRREPCGAVHRHGRAHPSLGVAVGASIRCRRCRPLRAHALQRERPSGHSDHFRAVRRRRLSNDGHAARVSSAAPRRLRCASVIPSGVIVVEAECEPRSGEVRHASVYRTARRLFQGEVLFSRSASRTGRAGRPRNRS